MRRAEKETYQARLWLLLFVGMVAVVARAVLRIRPESEHFWDFRVYEFAIKAQLAGLDPYRPESLQAVCACSLPIAYVYPPATLWLFWPLSALPEAVAFYGHLALMVSAVFALLWVWRRRLEIDFPPALTLFLFWFGFGGAGATALYAGNLVIVEVLLLWIALDRFVRQGYVTAAALVAIVSMLKIAPGVLFLPVGAAAIRPRRRLWALAPAGAFAAFFAWQRLVMPERFASWLEAVRGTDWERGAINPSSLALARDLAGSAGPYLYGAMVVLATGLLAAALYGRLAALLDDETGRRELAMVAAATLAIVVPRFKDYTYIFLIPPLLFAARKAPRASVVLFLLGAFSIGGLAEGRLASLPAAIRLFAEYQPLACAWATFFVLLWHVRRLERRAS